MTEFHIDEAYLTDVNVRHETRREINDKHDLIKAIKQPYTMVSISNKDHDEFTKLREHLGEQGYIEIQRSWWNGDRVLKQFRLNGFLFRKGKQFPSAAAMGIFMKVARTYNRKTLS